MAITLNELKAKYAAAQAPAPAVPEVKVEEKKATIWSKSADALKSTGRALDGSLPVSKRMFAEMATKRLDEHDVELRLIQHELELMAYNTGQQRPSREDLLAYDAQLQKEKAEAEEAERQARAAEAAGVKEEKKEEIPQSVVEQLAAAMAEFITPKPKEEPAKAEEEAPATDYEAVEKEHLGDIEKGTGVYHKSETEKEETVPTQDKPTSGRRRLPRQEPLMQ